jgi:acetate---CoA ligase (ADP-forming)
MLRSLLFPESIAVIGASRTPGKVGYAVVSNLKNDGYAGTIVPVNPAGGEVVGLPIYPDLATYGKPIEMAVIAVPTKMVQDAAEAAIDAGAKAIIVITAGFKEVDAEGAAMEHELERCAPPAASISSARTASA